MKNIPFNIWDDFYDDGHVPEGESQETHGYVEEYDELTEGQREEIATLIHAHILTLDMSGVEIEMCGDRIEFTHLTHARLERLIAELQGSGLRWHGLPIDFYSES